MPTSLTYIILSTRGCSPWRPAADMGTAWREHYERLARTFKCRQSCTGHHKKCGALRALAISLSPAKPIPGIQPLTKKRELFPGLPPTNPRSFALPHRSTEALQSPRPGSGILTRFPFDQNQASYSKLCLKISKSLLSERHLPIA